MQSNDDKCLKLPQIFNLNFGLLGILFAWELEITNVSGLYTFFGAKESDLGYLWLFPSIIGTLIPLIVGYFSDRTVTAFGKRLPYIFIGSIGTGVSLFLLPNSSSLIMVVIMLCIFTATINMALQPYRPLVADVVSARLYTKVYAVQSVLIGLGATLASVAPWVFLSLFGKHLKNSGAVPDEVTFTFYLGAIILIITNTWTVLIAKKYLPNITKNIVEQKAINRDSKFLLKIKTIYVSIIEIPKIMWQVSLVQVFTWLGVFCFIVYFTPTIEHAVFHLPIGTIIKRGSHYHHVVEKSVVLTGLSCAVYMFVNVIFAYCIPYLAKIMTRKTVHFLSLLIGGISFISINYIHTTPLLFLAMIGVGIAWASFNSIPFAMIASSLPENKLGLYMAIFNIAICLPQIIVSLSAGVLLKTVFHNHAAYLIVLAGILMMIAALLTLPIKDKRISVN